MTSRSPTVISGTRPWISAISRPLPIGQRVSDAFWPAGAGSAALIASSARPSRRTIAVDPADSVKSRPRADLGADDRRRHAADDPGAETGSHPGRERLEAGCRPARYSGSFGSVADVADFAQVFAVGVGKPESLDDRRAQCSATAGPGRRGRRQIEPSIGCDPQRQRIAGEQAFDRPRGDLRLFVGLRLERGIGLANPAIGDRDQRRSRSAAAPPSGSTAAWRGSKAWRNGQLRTAMVKRPANSAQLSLPSRSRKSSGTSSRSVSS